MGNNLPLLNQLTLECNTLINTTVLNNIPKDLQNTVEDDKHTEINVGNEDDEMDKKLAEPKKTYYNANGN
jgi:hypothetical protein